MARSETVKPITPAAALKRNQFDLDEGIGTVNEALARRWSSYDRANGRCISVSLMGPEWAEVVEVFAHVGWAVVHTFDQRDGDFCRFTEGAS